MLACSQPDKKKKIDFSGESHSGSRVTALASAGRAQGPFFGVPHPGVFKGALAKDEYDAFRKEVFAWLVLASSMKKENLGGEQYLSGTASAFPVLWGPSRACCSATAPTGSHKEASLMSLWVSTLDPLCAEGNGRLSQPFNAMN